MYISTYTNCKISYLIVSMLIWVLYLFKCNLCFFRQSEEYLYLTKHLHFELKHLKKKTHKAYRDMLNTHLIFK